MIQLNSAATNLKLAKSNIAKAGDELNESALNRDKVIKLRQIEGHIGQAVYKLEQLLEEL